MLGDSLPSLPLELRSSARRLLLRSGLLLSKLEADPRAEVDPKPTFLAPPPERQSSDETPVYFSLVVLAWPRPAHLLSSRNLLEAGEVVAGRCQMHPHCALPGGPGACARCRRAARRQEAQEPGQSGNRHLVALHAHALGVSDQRGQLLGPVAHVEAPVLAVLVLVREVLQAREHAHVAAQLVHHLPPPSACQPGTGRARVLSGPGAEALQC